MNTQEVLLQIFKSYAGNSEDMDGMQWTRLLRLSGLISVDFTSGESDMIFARAKQRSRCKLDFTCFVEAIELLCNRMSWPLAEVALRLCPNPLVNSTPRTTCPRGPVRFFYDPSTYTGIHTKGGPAIVDKVYEGPIYGKLDLSQLCDRSKCDTRGRKISCASTPGFSTHQDRKRAASAGRSTAPVPQTRSSDVSTSSSSSMRGPARFFYDQSTYTGIHKPAFPMEPQYIKAPLLWPRN